MSIRRVRSSLARALAAAATLLTLSVLASPPRAAAAGDDDDDAASTAKPVHKKVDTGDETTGTAAATSDEDKASVKAATEVITEYLEALKAKKWDQAKALTHPLTLKAIASTKKRLGEERHSMAPWYWAKDSFYLTNYKLDNVAPALNGTVVARTLEDSFQVQEKGELTGEKAAYLLGKSGGRWYVVDKKNEADGFTKDAIQFGYPGYFDGVAVVKPKARPSDEIRGSKAGGVKTGEE